MEPFHRLRTAAGERLTVAGYQAEFEQVFASARDTIWKLERAQEFYEPDLGSWQAMIDGDWKRSLALMEEWRAPLAEMYATRAGFRRLRVVETPITPYVQWELNFLMVRAAAGEGIRVLAATAVRGHEPVAPLPELVIFSPELCYEVLYDAVGAHIGARRLTDPDVITPCADILVALYDRAEPLTAFHAREIAPLPPPAVTPDTAVKTSDR